MTMQKMVMIILCLSLCILVFPHSSAQAYNSIGVAWSAFYPDACGDLNDAATACFLCHAAGTALNPYGEDVAAANEDFGAIEGDDSDSDGRTNGEEILNDCSLPGDATSATTTRTWSLIKSLYVE
jgi:hypothetical protein